MTETHCLDLDLNGKRPGVKFGLSGKHTKFEKNLPRGFDKSADLLSKCQNHEEDFFKFRVLLKKSKLYHQHHISKNWRPILPCSYLSIFEWCEQETM